MIKEIALIGNQNCGKTSLFNRLTGSRQKVGNWAGVTVEKKEGLLKHNRKIKVVDLPGLYSLSADTLDEKVVSDYIEKSPPSLIINVVDGTNLERGLKLTLELIERKIPMILAINMCDELDKHGIKINDEMLSKQLDIPVYKISATKNINVDSMIKKVIEDKAFVHQMAKSSLGIKELVSLCVKKENVKTTITDKIDKIVLNRYLGIPIFFAIMSLIYFVSIKLGGILGDFIGDGFNNLEKATAINLARINTPKFLISIICDAIFKGVGTVISFVPQVIILFFFMTILEESGYMSRVAFLFDRIFCYFGLSGKSLIPFILSCGCAVTGVLSTRTIETEKERKATIYLAPFMPCGAKLAVFAWLSKLLFNGSALIATSLYFISIVAIILGGLILKKFKWIRNDSTCFVLDIPIYRLPSFKNIYYALIEKLKDFLVKAGTVIFAVSIVLWLLTNFGFSGYVGDNVEQSFLRVLGDSFKYLFYPLGFNNWQIPVSIISGIFAKEAVIDSLTMLSASPSLIFGDNLNAYVFLVFVLLSPPCMATIISAKRELKDRRSFIFMILFQFCIAYIISFIVRMIAQIYISGLLTIVIISVIILTLFIISLKSIFRDKCKGCAHCVKCKKEK